MASYGQSHFMSRLTGSANRSAFLQGLAGCQSLQPGPDGLLNTFDDTGGAIPGVRAGCQPLDIFGPGTLSNVDPDGGGPLLSMVDFLSTTTFSQTIVEENRIGGYIRGDLFELPAGPIAAALGGAALYVGLHAAGVTEQLATTAGVLITLALRLAGIRWKISLPLLETR